MPTRPAHAGGAGCLSLTRPALQEWACAALAALACEAASHPGKGAGTLKAVAAAMQQHGEVAGVQERGCEVRTAAPHYAAPTPRCAAPRPYLPRRAPHYAAPCHATPYAAPRCVFICPRVGGYRTRSLPLSL